MIPLDKSIDQELWRPEAPKLFVDCDACHGTGSVVLWRMNSSVQIVCPKCQGNGQIKVNHP